MAAPGKLPPPAELKRLQAEGKLASDVTEMFGVKTQSVYNKQSTARIKREYAVRPQNQFMPWELMKPIHQRSMVARRLRHAHALAGDDGAMDPTVRNVTESWLRGLECNDFVISYHPDTPPNAFSEEGGFFRRPRRSGDIPGIMQLPGRNEQPPTGQMVQEWEFEWTNGS